MLTHRAALTDGWLIADVDVSPYPGPAPAGAAPRRVRMLLDTGARGSVVREDVLLALGLVPIGSRDVRTTLEVVTTSRSASSPARPRRRRRRRHRHTRGLGLDFLRHFRLSFDGPGRHFELSLD